MKWPSRFFALSLIFSFLKLSKKGDSDTTKDLSIMTLQAPKVVLSFNFCFLIHLSLKIIFKNECTYLKWNPPHFCEHEMSNRPISISCVDVVFANESSMWQWENENRSNSCIWWWHYKKLTHTTGFKVHLTLLWHFEISCEIDSLVLTNTEVYSHLFCW